MKTSELKKKYLEFYKSKGHVIIDSAPLIPEHDPTVLFTTAGMHPLIPFLMGQKHPLGTRIADVQKCIRTQDIDEVGDATHTTFFEMLGNWSLGDYFKEDAIKWSFEFLASKDWLGLDINRLAVSCFEGDKDAPKDEEAANIWKTLGISEKRIAYLPKSENWWGPAGTTGPCGPDTEMFYWKDNNTKAPEKFDPEDNRWVEIWNDVFMQYNKVSEGKFEPLAQKNVDTGLGVERVAMVLQGKENIFDIEVFQPIIEKIKQITDKDYQENFKSFAVITDHMKAATFILGDERGVPPSNLDQGYILRRYIRRSLRHLRLLGVDLLKIDSCSEIAKVVINIYKEEYPILSDKKDYILSELKKEEDKFQITLDKGLREFTKMVEKDNQITATEAFLLYQSYGFPIEMIQELASEKDVPIDVEGFNEEYKKHQELSRKGAEQRFKGGLSEASDVTSKLHTATHILGQALRKVLKDENIVQKGSNITPERLRYDFNFDRKLTPEEKKAVEDEVNKVIDAGIEVVKEEMAPEDAIKQGAQAEFGSKYPPKVTVYTIGDYSKDICMGPHVANTKDLGHFKIKKEESSAAGIRRIKAVLE